MKSLFERVTEGKDDDADAVAAMLEIPAFLCRGTPQHEQAMKEIDERRAANPLPAMPKLSLPSITPQKFPTPVWEKIGIPEGDWLILRGLGWKPAVLMKLTAKQLKMVKDNPRHMLPTDEVGAGKEE